jgi:predicted flap endonuclease-1-like 5' DNA nuclease
MMARLAALAAGIAAAVAGAAGAVVWARRKGAGSKRRTRRHGRRTPAATGMTRTAAGSEPRAADSAGVAAQASAAPVEPGGLRSIKGIGAVSEERLQALGVTTVTQIAAWSDEDIADIAARINISAERIRHEDWVGQARAAAGG